MDIGILLQFFEENGYVGLFLWLWLGIFGLPVPNEIISMSVGLASSQKVLNSYLTFIVTLAGIFAALTTSYVMGRFVGRPLLKFFTKRQKFANAIDTSLKLMDKYKAQSLLLSYFVPGLRTFVPFLYGFSRLSFRNFTLYAYSGAFIWLSLMYSAGFLFGDHLEEIVQYGKKAIILGVLVVGAAGMVWVLWKKTRKKANSGKNNDINLVAVEEWAYSETSQQK